MRAADLFKKTRKFVRPPYGLYEVFALLGGLIILLSIPLTVISLQQRTVFKASADVDGLVSKINAYRASKGLVTLSQDQKLVNAACWMANDMATKNYFSHTDSLGRDPFARMAAFGVGSSYWRGETLAAGSSTGQQTFDLWKNSPGHNSVMLNPNFRRIGVGAAYKSGSTYGYYWTADYASGSATSVTNQCELVDTGTIQGYKVVMPGNKNQSPAAGQTVKLDGGSPTTANPYYFRNVKTGNHAVSVSVPSGYKVGYTLCYNKTTCHGGTPTTKSSVTVNVPAGGYADLWWHYTDIKSPTVSITSPSNGATVSGTKTITASASDNVGVTKVELRVDGALKKTDTSSPYSYSWDTTAVSNGSHSLQARAYDVVGNVGTSTTISVTVNNALAPTVDIKANGSGGPITISYNTSVTLSWSSTNTTSCTASGGWSGSKGTSGSESTGSLTSSKTFTLTCTGPGGSAVDSVTVNVSSPPTKPGDINGDGVVNIFDASILASRWGTADPDADLNGNGVVDIFDASIMATNWDG